MKKGLFLLYILLFSITNIFSVDLLPIGRDFQTLLDELGKESIPLLLQNGLAGQGIGAANLRDDRRFFMSTSCGALLAPGILTFIDEEDTFELLNVSGLIESALGEASESIAGLYGKSRSFFPYPNLRLAIGFKSFFESETIFLFSIWPQGLTNLATGLANIEGITFNRMNAGLRLRKTLLNDSGGFPSISMGLGYIFSNFNMGYGLPEDFSQDLGGSALSLQGDIGIHTTMHSVGCDLALSKRLLFFVPFLQISTWYQWIHYVAEIAGFETTVAGDVYTDQGGTDPTSDQTISDLAVILKGGFELEFKAFALILSGSYGLTSRTFGVNLGSRFQF